MRVGIVVGNRPQLIKFFPFCDGDLIYTGQHYSPEMKDIFFRDMKLEEPKYDLGETTLEGMQTKLEEVFKKEKYELVIVYGDTNSTLAGAKAAYKLNIPIAHVEAGYRCGEDITEEVIRKIVDTIAKYKFCGSQDAYENLVLEELCDENTYFVGDVLLDSMSKFCPIKVREDKGTYWVLTIHRDFNADNPEHLRNIFKALGESKEKIIFPIHPRTRKANPDIPKNIETVDPIGYKEMLELMANAKGIITDSGGAQKEAYWLMTPCVTLRDNTEYPETVEAGWNQIVGSDPNKIVEAMKNIKRSLKGYQHFYGTGKVNYAIDNILRGEFEKAENLLQHTGK
jgi:UDP-GlcNAc3NAcA epimerase